LQDERLRQRARDPVVRAPERIQPSPGFQAERDRRRLLEPRPSRHRRGGVKLRVAGRGLRRAGEVTQDLGHRGAELQHEPGVEDVLAGRAPVHVARRVRIRGRHPRREMADEGDGDVARARRFPRYRAQVVVLGPGRGADGRDGGAGDDSDFGFRVREHGLDVEHGLQARAVREARRHPGLAEQSAVEVAHTSKNTVSSCPWSTMSKW
jgi:hypothetical protein